MSEENVEVKEKAAPEIRIQYEPYEKYLTRILINIHNRLEKIERMQDVIKERITCDYTDGKKD